MLRKLFKRRPRLDADDPADRIAALSDLNDTEQEVFARLLHDDPDGEVRRKAIERLTRLDALAGALDDADVSPAAAARLLDLIDENTPASIRDHPAVLPAALTGATSAGRAVEVAESIADAATRAGAIVDHPRADIRQAVGEATWDQAVLVELERRSRGRDKLLHRLARGRLARLRTAATARDAEDATTEKLLDAALALDEDDPHYDARRDAIERDWSKHLDAMSATDAELAAFAVPARDLDAVANRLPARRQVQPPVEVHTEADFEPLLARARSLLDAANAPTAEGLDEEAVAALAAQTEALAEEWSELADHKPPTETMSATFRQSMATVAERVDLFRRALALAPQAMELTAGALPDPAGFDSADAALREIRHMRDAIERLQARYRWPDDLPALPALAALEQRRADLETAVAGITERTEATAAEVTALLGELRDCVERGAVHDAVEKDRLLRDRVRQLPRGRAQAFGAELAEVGARVRELMAWRTYAEAPKREALCRQMEEIADTPLAVHAQAESVKTLRAEWNGLGPPDTRRDRELKKRFDQAAERAFEPCRVHFREQAERRAFNLEQRQAIVGALEGFLRDNDWDDADWRGVEKVLRQARSEWRHYHPVDRKAGRSLAARFEELAESIHGLLREEWSRNVERKEAIVADAVGVRESGATATDKAEAMKELQRRWKTVGPLPRRADQRLWQQFRAECDIVFEARNAARGRHTERLQAISDTEALITELERRLDIDPALDRNTVADYQRRLDDLGSLPRELQRRAATVLADADRIVAERQAARAAREGPGSGSGTGA